MPVIRGQGIDVALAGPVDVMSKNGALIFFPEGQCIRNEFLAEPRVGIGFLALKFPEALILPIAIKNSYRVKGPKLFNRPTVKVAIGEAVKVKNCVDLNGSLDPADAAKTIMRMVADLYHTIE